MPELKLTVVTPDPGSQDEARDLDELMAALAAEAGRHAQLQRSAPMGRGDGPLRVFNARFSGEDALSALLRGCGTWYMRHPSATVTFKIESSKGGTTLQMKSYSPVALAQAAAQLWEYLE